MSFFTSVPPGDSAVDRQPALPWPIGGVAYTAMDLGPLGGGGLWLLLGLLKGSFGLILLGLLLGPGLFFGTAWVFDHYVDFWIAKRRARLGQGLPFVFINTAAFAWGILLGALPIFTPLIIVLIRK